MTIWGFLEAGAEWFLIGAAVMATAFVLLYGFRSPWWEISAGRAILGEMTAVAVILDLVVVFNRVWAPPPRVLLVLSFIFYGLFLATLVWLNVALLQAQRRRAKHRGSSDTRQDQ